ncbi:Putative protein of unknown function [Podospora comata]|uniref:Uncharacterized protein n=1 Tax=Podospora comata TaxID=48703 RepID=A0ABY6SAA6_PODCO|nr:Putative protein of unknown function [Podospora comata]
MKGHWKQTGMGQPSTRMRLRDCFYNTGMFSAAVASIGTSSPPHTFLIHQSPHPRSGHWQDRNRPSGNHCRLPSSSRRLRPPHALKTMASTPNQSSAFLSGHRRARTRQLIKKPFKKIFIKSILLSAFTQQQPPPSPPPSTSFASSSSHQHRDPTPPPPPRSSPHSRPTSRRSSSTTTTSSQLIWRLSDDTLSCSSLQLAAHFNTTTRLSDSCTIPLSPYLYQEPQQNIITPFNDSHPSPLSTPHYHHYYYSTEHSHTYNHFYVTTMSGSRSSSLPPTPSGSMPIEQTPAFQKLLPVERARAFIHSVVFEEDEELSEEEREHITIKCEKTWTDLLKLGNLDEKEGTEECQKLVRAPVIGEGICHKLWKRLAAISRKGGYTNEASGFEAMRKNLMVEGKARREEKKREKEERRKEREGRKGVEGLLDSLKLSPRRKDKEGSGSGERDEGEGGGEQEGEEGFWQAPETYTPRIAPPEMEAKDTPCPPGLLGLLEGDDDEMARWDQAAYHGRVGVPNRKIEENVGGDEEEEAVKNAEDKNKRKAAEAKEGSRSCQPKLTKSKSWIGKIASMGEKVSYGLGVAGPAGSKGPKEDRSRKKSI